MKRRMLAVAVPVLVLMVLVVSARAAEKGGGPPPAKVVTAKVGMGEVAPQADYVGSVYFAEVSDVASETWGKVVAVEVEEAQRVAKGKVMVRLSSDLFARDLEAARAELEHVKADYEFASLNTRRMTKLFQSNSVSEGEYDETRLGAEALKSEVAKAEAKVARIELEIEKKIITAPFDGVVIKRDVYLGEWVAKGTDVVKLGSYGLYDVVVNVPEEIARLTKAGDALKVRVGGREFRGRVFAVIPRGDVATRTFPVKIRIKATGLSQGMEARLLLKAGKPEKLTVVPRDAVIAPGGQTVVFAVLDGKAVPFPVQVTGYKGMMAGVRAQGLKPGMDVVVKGNERLRPGQPVAASPR